MRAALFFTLSVYCILLYFGVFIHCPCFTSGSGDFRLLQKQIPILPLPLYGIVIHQNLRHRNRLCHVLQSLSSALPPAFSNPEALHGDAEPLVSGRLQRSIQFLHIEPLHALHFLFLQGKLFSIYRLGVHVDKRHFIIPEHFSIEFFFVLNIKASGECKILL